MATVIDQFVTEFLFRYNRGNLKALETRIDSIRGRLDGMARGATVIGTLAVGAATGIGAVAVSTDRKMKKLQAITQMSAEELKVFKEQAYEVGSRLPLDTADIIQAQIELYKLGISAKDTLTITPAIAETAVAAGENIAEVARWGAIAMNTFKLDAKEVPRVLDQMLMVETKTPAAVRELGESYQYSANMMSDINTKTEEYLSLLGIMAGAGRSPESASQGLKEFFAKVQKMLGGEDLRSAKLARDAFENIGIDKEEVAAIMNQDQAAIRLLRLMNERSQGNIAGLHASMGQLAGTTYLDAMAYLARNIEKVDVLAKGPVAGAEGFGEEQARIMMEGLSGSWEGLKAQFDTFMNRLGDIAYDDIQGFLDRITNFLGALVETNEYGELTFSKFLNLLVQIIKWGSGLLLVAAGLKLLSWTLGAFMLVVKGAKAVTAAYSAVMLWFKGQTITTSIALGWLTVSTKINAIATAFAGGVANIFGRALAFLRRMTILQTAAQWALNLAMSANPIGLIILGIAALIAGIVLVIANWDKVKNAFMKGSVWISNLFRRIGRWIQNLIPDWIKDLFGMGEKITLTFEDKAEATERAVRLEQELEQAKKARLAVRKAMYQAEGEKQMADQAVADKETLLREAQGHLAEARAAGDDAQVKDSAERVRQLKGELGELYNQQTIAEQNYNRKVRDADKFDARRAKLASELEAAQEYERTIADMDEGAEIKNKKLARQVSDARFETQLAREEAELNANIAAKQAEAKAKAGGDDPLGFMTQFTGGQTDLNSLFGGNLPVASPEAVAAFQGGPQNLDQRTVTINQTNHVDARGGDSKEIAQGVSKEMHDQTLAVMEDKDTQVLR